MNTKMYDDRCVQIYSRKVTLYEGDEQSCDECEWNSHMQQVLRKV